MSVKGTSRLKLIPTNAQVERALERMEICVVTYNSAQVIKECIESLRRQLPTSPLHVVDNNSADDTAGVILGKLRAKLSSIRINSENYKLSRTWNSFLREGTSELVLFLNPDVFIHDKAFLQCGAFELLSNPDVAIAGRIHHTTLGKLIDYVPPVAPEDRWVFRRKLESSPWLKRNMGGGSDYAQIPFPYPDGCCFLASRRLLLKLGGFDEELPLYFNDSELMLRILDAGYVTASIWETNDGALMHIGQDSSNGTAIEAAAKSSTKLEPGIAVTTRSLPAHSSFTIDSQPNDPEALLVDAYRRALDWTLRQVKIHGAIPVTSNDGRAYPEVSGYFIPTLIDAGEFEAANRLAEYLLGVQLADGGFPGPGSNIPYTFDTGQVLRGLNSILSRTKRVAPALERAYEWILSHILPTGRMVTEDQSTWVLPDGKLIPEAINLNVLAPLTEAARLLDRTGEREADSQCVIEKCLQFYTERDVSRFSSISHHHAYILEALLELGAVESFEKGLTEVLNLQRRDGSIPAYPDSLWVCSPGMAQLAALCFRHALAGKQSPSFVRAGEAALHALARQQTSSGAFPGSFGPEAKYFENDEPSWTVKFFLDAYHLYLQTKFDSQLDAFFDDIDDSDGRMRAIVDICGDLNSKAILDVGCGKGRYLKALRRKFPDSTLRGVDLSPALVRYASTATGAEIRVSSLTNILHEDDSFDVVIAVESLEHSLNINASIAELVRVLRPGGKLIIIDKNRTHAGRLAIEAWESWFDESEILSLLERSCDDLSCKPITYDQHTVPDGLFLCWWGTKR